MNYNFTLERLRFHFQQQNTLIAIGWYREDNPDGRTLVAIYGQEELPIAYDNQMGIPIRQKYLALGADVSEEIHAYISLPDDWSYRNDKLRLYCEDKQGRQVLVAVCSKKQLLLKRNSVEYCIESDSYMDGKITLSGWAAGKEDVLFELVNKQGQAIPYTIEKNYRKDVRAVYTELDEDYKSGFRIVANIGERERIFLGMRCQGNVKSVYKSALRLSHVDSRFIQLALKGLEYCQENGIKNTLHRIQKKIKIKKKDSYEKWRKENVLTKQQIEKQKEYVMNIKNGPKFSIVVPLYQTSEKYLCELMDSILNQTYPEWELCLADGSGKDYEKLESLVGRYQKKDRRIHYQKLENNLGISGNTNAAIQMATGDYIVLADHDDVLTLDALYECAVRIMDGRTTKDEVDVLYSDEDKIDMDSKKYFEPNFKPDFSIDYLCSMNYICHLFVVKKELLKQIGLFRSDYDGAQDHDFILRCVEVAKRICHIPRILYHWRSHPSSTAVNPESKMYAFEAGKKAVQAHYDRVGIPASVSHGQFYGMYKTTYHWDEKPLISIVIPNKDHVEDLKVCMQSIEQHSSYRNYEFIVVENNSVEEETFAYYKELEKKENVTVLYYSGGFNFSKINNFGVKAARGEYILLLNNDTEIINPECIDEMLGYCMRKDVGIVGARLYYKDDTIQHAGVVLGFGGIAGHTFIEASRYDSGYMNRIICAQNYSAVTAACMMVKKSVFEQVGGLTEELAVAFNDIDFCMKVRKAGYLVVYNPAVELYHYESKSRGLEDSPEKVARFNSEVEVFANYWKNELKQGDPYYNPNLSLNRSDFGLKE